MSDDRVSSGGPPLAAGSAATGPVSAARSEALRSLGRSIAETEDALLRRDRVAERAVERFEPSIHDGRKSGVASRPLTRRRSLVLGLLAAAIGLVVAFVVVSRKASPAAWVEGGTRIGVGDFVRADDASARVRFTDGTTVTIAPRSRGRLIALDGSGGEVAVEDGRATVSVPPHQGRAWTIDAGPYRVLVTGTRFDVGWDEGARRFDLVMYEGRVEVRGPNTSAVTVVGGEHLSLEPSTIAAANVGARPSGSSDPPLGATSTASPSSQPSAIALEPSSGAATDASPPTAGAGRDLVDAGPVEGRSGEGGPASVAAGSTVAPTPRSTQAPGPKGWRALARESHFQEAVEAAEALGFDSVCASASAKDLLMLADAARLANRGDRARTAYAAVRSKHAGSPEAARAAFALGVMAFPSQSALPLLEEYLSSAPDGPLAPEALGRILEIRHRSGDTAGARSAASAYLSSYPNGAHAKLARSILASD